MVILLKDSWSLEEASKEKENAPPSDPLMSATKLDRESKI